MPNVARAPRFPPSQGKLAAVAVDAVALTQVLPEAVAPKKTVRLTLPPLPLPGLVNTNPAPGSLPAAKVNVPEGVICVSQAARQETDSPAPNLLQIK